MFHTFSLFLLFGLFQLVALSHAEARTLHSARDFAQESRSSQTRPSKKLPPVVLQQLRRADQLFLSRDYERALFLYTQILKRSPELSSARINLARCLYKLGRFEDAYQAFQGLRLDELDPEARYESAQSALKMKDFAKALEGFRAVPSGHSLYDLANYYGAICASNLQNYQLAAELMRQAVVLPSKLAPSKKAYLKHIEEMIAQQPSSEKEDGPEAAKSEGAREQATKEAKSSVSGSGFGLKAGNTLGSGIISSHQTQRFEEAERENIRHRRQEVYLEGQHVQHVPINTKEANDPHHMVFHFRMRLSQLEQELREARFPETDMTELRRLFRSQSANDQQFISEIDSGLLPQWYVSQDTWLLVEGQFKAVYPGFDLARSYSHLIGGLGLGIQKQDYEGSLLFRIIDTSGEGKRQYSRSQQDLQLSLLPASRFSIAVLARMAQYSYSQKEIDGPDSLLLFQVDGRLRLSSIAHVQLGGYMERLDGQRRHRIADIPVIGYNQSASGGRLSFQLVPFSWLNLSLEVQNQDRIFEQIIPSEPATTTALMAAEPSNIIDITARANFHWQF